MEDSYSSRAPFQKRKEFFRSRNSFSPKKCRKYTSPLALLNFHEENSCTPVVDPLPLISSEEPDISPSEPRPSLQTEKIEPQQIG
jgi:hypothetical protein